MAKPAKQRQRYRELTILAQDPSVRHPDGRLVRAKVRVPYESVGEGPYGGRVHVIDYDAATDTLYQPLVLPDEPEIDPFAGASDDVLRTDPRFHAQNVYAIVMCTLQRFERALGRRVSWAFPAHQIKIAPHAFADANAFYSRGDEALLFGYFPKAREGDSAEGAGEGGGFVFSCLSHDVVAHEATHALLDGLRGRLMDRSSPDQAAFHEGFADLIAILSVFSLKDLISAALEAAAGGPDEVGDRFVLPRTTLTADALRSLVVVKLAEEMGQEMADTRGNALRQSAKLQPSLDHLAAREFQAPHRRGEILVAAIISAFLDAWAARIVTLGDVRPGWVDRERVVEEGAAAAEYLLTMCIRGLDYLPPVHVEFGDFLSALLTGDYELTPDEGIHKYREALRKSFGAFGIEAAGQGQAEPGLWKRADNLVLEYSGSHHEGIQRDRDEVFAFVWANRGALDLCEGAYSRILSLRPVMRVGPDGFGVRETVAEFMQTLSFTAEEVAALGINCPADMPPSQPLKLHGGGTLIFDDFGRLRYNIHNRLTNAERQTRRIAYLWSVGAFGAKDDVKKEPFAALHLGRIAPLPELAREAW